MTEPEDKNKYRAGFLKKGITGITYQLKILTWVTWKLMSKKEYTKDLKKWWLATEVSHARGIHDLVLKYVNLHDEHQTEEISDGKCMYRFMQIKHMNNSVGLEIGMNHLLSEDRDYCQYSLIFLFKSYLNALQQFEGLTSEQIADITVFTNRSVKANFEFLAPMDNDDIFDFDGKGQRYRLDIDKMRKKKVVISRLRALTSNDKLVCDFLNKVVYAVSQPSESELNEFILKDMGKIYNSPQIFYNDLFKEITDWFVVLKKNHAPYLTEEHVRKHMQKMEDILLAEKKNETLFTIDSLSLSNMDSINVSNETLSSLSS